MVGLFVEKALYRAIRQPRERAGHQQAHAVAGHELDELQPVEARKQPHAFGFREVVFREDLIEADVVQHTNRHEEQLPIRDDLFLLLVRELRNQRLVARECAGEV